MSLTDFFPSISDSLADPFHGDPVQTKRTKAYCVVEVAGVNVTSALEPFLISVHIVDGANEYQCEIELDDRDGRLPIPALNSPLSVSLGWTAESVIKVWTGLIQDVEHGFGRRQGGRRMWIKGNGGNFMGGVKSQAQDSHGDGAPPGQQEGPGVSLNSVLSSVAGASGLKAVVHGELGSITRDHWSQNNESGMHFVQRLANELGATFRLRGGDSLEFTKPGEIPSGGNAGTVICKWGVNLIGYRVRPMAARPSWGGSNQQFFDTKAGQWMSVAKQFGLPNPWALASSVFRLPNPAPNAGVADQHNGGAANQISFGGDGTIIINGEPRAQMSSVAQIVGVRPGVDGEYLVKNAHHVYSRQGYTTRLHVGPNASGVGAGSISAGYIGVPSPGLGGVAPATPSAPGPGNVTIGPITIK